MSNFKTDFAKFQHEYIFLNIQAADQKAAILLAIASGLLGYVSSNKSYTSWLATGLLDTQAILAAVASAFLIISAACSLKVIWPNLTGSAKGLVYWRTVAAFSHAKGFLEKVGSKDDEALTGEILEHNFEAARVCEKKFQWLRAALWAGLIGAAVLFIDFSLVSANANSTTVRVAQHKLMPMTAAISMTPERETLNTKANRAG